MCSAHIRLLRCHLLVHFGSNRLQLMFRKRRTKRLWLLVADAMQVVLPQLCVWCDCFWRNICIAGSSRDGNGVFVTAWLQSRLLHSLHISFQSLRWVPSVVLLDVMLQYVCDRVLILHSAALVSLPWLAWYYSELLLFSGEEAKDCRAPQTWLVRSLWGSSTGEHPLRRPLKIKVAV